MPLKYDILKFSGNPPGMLVHDVHSKLERICQEQGGIFIDGISEYVGAFGSSRLVKGRLTYLVGQVVVDSSFDSEHQNPATTILYFQSGTPEPQDLVRHLEQLYGHAPKKELSSPPETKGSSQLMHSQ